MVAEVWHLLAIVFTPPAAAARTERFFFRQPLGRLPESDRAD